METSVLFKNKLDLCKDIPVMLSRNIVDSFGVFCQGFNLFCNVDDINILLALRFVTDLPFWIFCPKCWQFWLTRGEKENFSHGKIQPT